jgi:hypothetical protein
MRRMDLDAGESRLLGRMRGGGKAVDDFRDVGIEHRDRLREQLAVLAHVQRHRRRRPRQPTHVRHDLAARVADLHPGLGAVCAYRLRPGREGRERGVRFERDGARTGQRAPVDHHVAGDDSPAPPSAQRRYRRWMAGPGNWPASAMVSSMAALARRFGTMAPFGRVRGVNSMRLPSRIRVDEVS